MEYAWFCFLYSFSFLLFLLKSIYLPPLTKSEKAMATHSSTLAWKIPWMEEPGRLQSIGSRRVRHNWATSLSLFTSMHWRRKWQPTPVFLPGESQGQQSLVGCGLWGSHRVRHDWLKQLSSSSSSNWLNLVTSSVNQEQIKKSNVRIGKFKYRVFGRVFI